MHTPEETLKAAARRQAVKNAEPGTSEASINAAAAALYRHNRDELKRMTEAAVERKRKHAEYRPL